MTQWSTEPFRASAFWHPRYWYIWFCFGLLRLFSLLPYPALVWLGARLGRFLKRITAKHQRIIDINLALCLPQKSAQERVGIRNSCYENLGISLFEVAMCWWWPKKRLIPLVEVRGKEHLDAVLSRGQGAILLSGHFTSLEIGSRLLALSVPMQVMYRAQKHPLIDGFIYARRSRYFVSTIARTGTRQLIKGIRNLVPTWYAPDQDFRDEKNVFAPFMGVSTATITASSRLVQAAGCAMLPFYTERRADGSGYLLTIEPPLDNFPTGDDYLDASAINAAIEKFVYQHPDQYMWNLTRFRTRPAGEPSIY